ncbi:MAG: MBL fold metallo-hydrolase [Gammaproteobacteria bacterium]|nr:MBL fold metallo-hydrolase [Gammaproteobacteria bacterium]
MPFPKRSILLATFISVLSLSISVRASAGELYTFTSGEAGFKTHSVFYDDGQEVIVVDTQFLPGITEELISAIKEETDSPITKVIVTHPNPDKFNGLNLLKERGVQSIASKATANALPMVHEYKRNFWVNVAEAIDPESYPELAEIDVTYEGKKVIKTQGGDEVTLIQLPGDAMSSDHTVVLFEDSGALFVGDLIHAGVHAWLEGPLHDGKPRPNVDQWIATLKELDKIEADRVLGGRGEWAPIEKAIRDQVHYLEKVQSIVENYVNERPNLARELQNATKAQEHFQSVTQHISAAFPDYDLPSMVRYSVYAMIQKEAEAL